MIRSLAWRSALARKGRAAMNALGVVLGVALIFAILSLSQTIVSTFEDLFGSVYAGTDLVVVAQDGVGTLEEPLLGKIKQIDGVDVAVGSVGGVMTLVERGEAGSGQADQVFVAGANPDDEDLSGSEVVAGEDVLTGNSIQLDEIWAKNHGLAPGETVSFATAAGLRDFKVTALFSIGDGLDVGGQGFAAINIATAREALGVPEGFSEISVRIDEGADLEAVRSEIDSVLPTGIEANTPNDIADEINAQIQGFNIILYFFAGMALFVGAFLILNSFNMTVAQRLREIGMLRTLGAGRGAIMRMFLVEALFIGIFGGVLGVVLGLLLGQLMIAAIGQVGIPIGDVKYPTSAFIIAPLMGVLATVFGALRPAWRASRIPPIQAVLVEHRAQPLKLARRIVAGSVSVVVGLIFVFLLASSSDPNTLIAVLGGLGVFLLFSGVIMLGPIVVPWLVRVLASPLKLIRPIEARLASDGSKANPLRTASTASGLMIGIALVAAIGSLGSSFIGSISNDLDKELKNDFTVQVPGLMQGGPTATIAPVALEQIEALPSTRSAGGVRMAFITEGYGKNYAAYGLNPQKHGEFSNPEYASGAASGVDQRLTNDGTTIPEALAKSEGTKVGDRITLAGPRGSKELEVVGVQKGNSFEATSIVVSNENFRSIYGINGYHQVLVVAKSDDARTNLRSELDDLIKRDHPALEVLSNEEIKQQIKDQVNQIFGIFYMIMMVAIIVSLLGVINTLFMNVLERTREIGVLRAIGSQRGQVRRVVVIESLLLTLAGAVIGLVVGIALGYAFVRGLAAADISASFHPPIAIIVTVTILAIVFAVLAALLPARRAARMNVIEAVSYE